MEFTRKIATGLALAGVLLTSQVVADDANTVVSTAAATVSTDQVSRQRATEANKTAAKEAIDAVLAATRLDLDIRLIGPTSVKIASDR